MFQGAVRLMVGRVLLAYGVLGCLLLSANAATASAQAHARAGVALPPDAASVAAERVARAPLNLRSCEAAAERSQDEAQRDPADPASPAAPREAAHDGAHFGSDASRFLHFGARPGRGAKGARDPGEVQRTELPTG
jgi:hypothetical protein